MSHPTCLAAPIPEHDSTWIAEQERAIVLAQLAMSSPGLLFSVDTPKGLVTYTRHDIVREVAEGTPFGRDFTTMQMDFIRSFKNGGLQALLDF